MEWQPIETARRDGTSVLLLHVVTFDELPFAKPPIPQMRFTKISVGGWHTPLKPGEWISIVQAPDPDRGYWSNGEATPLDAVAWAPIPVTSVGMDGLPILPWMPQPSPPA